MHGKSCAKDANDPQPFCIQVNLTSDTPTTWSMQLHSLAQQPGTTAVLMPGTVVRFFHREAFGGIGAMLVRSRVAKKSHVYLRELHDAEQEGDAASNRWVGLRGWLGQSAIASSVACVAHTRRARFTGRASRSG